MNLFLIFILLLLPYVPGVGPSAAPKHQQPVVGSGVYQTADDYQKGVLALPVDCRANRHKIKLHDLLGKPTFDVIHDGKKHTFVKAEVYGFRTCEGQTYRFFNNEEYLIRENGILTIYERTVAQPGISGKGTQLVPKFFFSLGNAGSIQPLMKKNVKEAFPEKHAFHDALDAQFATDDVSAYDDFHKMYRVNHLLHGTH